MPITNPNDLGPGDLFIPAPKRTHQFNVNCTADEYAYISRVAAQFNCPISDVVRAAMRLYYQVNDAPVPLGQDAPRMPTRMPHVKPVPERRV